MMDTAKSQKPSSALRHARSLLECGKTPPSGLLDAMVARSWQRSIEAGLVPFGRPIDPDPLTSSRLAQVIERRRSLVTRARPVMEYLHAQTRGAGSMVILADDQGVLLEALGDPDFVSRAERVALRPGASWHERHRGTNAIGTALAEAAPAAVHGGEHFLEHNSFLTCAAAPLMGPDGRLLGVLDISGHSRGRQAHTAGLVRAAAHMIENRLFEAQHEGGTRLHFHPQADGIGTVAEGLLAVSDDGRIIGANRAGMALFGLTAADLGHMALSHVLHLRMTEILTWGQTRPGSIMATIRADGQRLFLRIDSAPRRPQARSGANPIRSAAPTADALTALDTGDQRLSLVIRRARKVLDKPIPLLVQGESGVGKEVFAKAVHATGPRRHAPFVAVNCAALPEQLIEAELFGYAPGAFTGARREGAPGRIREANGGTLFLDEIGDMPPALQCRLLRVLQDRHVSPLGGSKAQAVDFALITASHRQLKREIEAGRFRADLYYRLNGLTVTLPALRERSDFTTLVARMIDEIEPGVALSTEVATALAAHHWPGNLRQLANTLRTACAMLDPGESRITWHHLPEDLIDDLRQPPPPTMNTAPQGTLREASDSLIDGAVAGSGGNLSEAARRLGVSRNTLYRRLRRVSATGSASA